MAGLGRKVFAAGEILTAANVQGYLQDQAVMVFDDSANRTTTLGTAVSEGMVAYLKDTDQLEVYNGSNWADVGQDLTTGTAGFTALSAGTAGISYQPVSHNYVINGAFDFWQRGTSFSGAGFVADRFQANSSGATIAVTRQSFTPNDITAAGFGDAKYFLRIIASVADDNWGILQNIEDVQTLANQTATFSFWAKADVDTTVKPALVQDFGSGGSSLVVTNGTDISITTSWQRYSQTLNVPSISGKTLGSGNYLRIQLLNPNNETGTIDTWGWQLEAGSIATPFKRHAPSLQGELAACQRYYQRVTATAFARLTHDGTAASATSINTVFPLHSSLRAAPSSLEFANLIVQDGAATLTPSAITISGSSSANLVHLNYTVSGATQFRNYYGSVNASATGFVAISAEL
jgi:hypothetical protein